MRSGSPVVVLLFGLSGVAGLGYQIVWTRLFSLGLGHEMPGLLAVVTAFFTGLALGGVAFDGLVSRSRRPGRWYAIFELVIAGWAIAVVLLAPWLNDLAIALMGAEPSAVREWTIAFAVPLIALLPATAAMGATLPAIERLAARLAQRGTTIAGLYAANTLGAMVGILLSAAVLLPALGLRATVFVLAGLNVLCAIGMWRGPAVGEAERAAVTHTFPDAPRAGVLAFVLFVTGALGIGFEVAGVRVLAQVLENTVYTFATTVSVYLLGTAAGAAAWSRFGPKDRFAAPAGWLLAAVGVGVTVGSACMPGAAAVYEGVRSGLSSIIGLAAASLAAEGVVALLVFGPATIAMGATFSHLLLAARRAEGGLGRAAGVNTLGGALAPALVGIVLIPMLGTRWTIGGLGLAYVLLIPLVARGGRRPLVVAAVTMGAVAFALPARFVFVDAPRGMTIMRDGVREGIMATVAVAEDERGGRVLKVNNQFSMGGTRVSFADRRQGHIPMLLHPDPKRALFLGVGAGLTAGAATLHGDAHVTAVELVPEVIDFLPRFSPQNRWEAIDRLVVADARRFVRADTAQYDVIVADLFHPARDGAGALYTREHFAAIRARLGDGGLFCQWLPLHQLDAPVAGMIVATFLEIFPEATGWIAAYNVRTPMLGLIGRTQAGPAASLWDTVGGDGTWLAAWADERGGDLADDLVSVALTHPLDLLGCRIGDAAALRALAGSAPLNVDDRPRVMFEAPWYTYGSSESGLQRVEELLALPGAATDGIRPPLAAPDGQTVRVDAFIAARDAFLRGAIAEERGDAATWERAMLEAVAASSDFGAAYTLLVFRAERMAAAGDPDRAIALLGRLVERRPERAEARAAQARIRGR